MGVLQLAVERSTAEANQANPLFTSDPTLASGATDRAPVVAAVEPLTRAINAQAAAYTFALTDIRTFVIITNASGVAATVPPNSTVAFPIGTRLKVAQGGAGLVTVTAGAGVTVRAGVGTLKLLGQYAIGEIVQVAANTWYTSGNYSAT